MRQFWMSHCFVPSREEWTHKREWTIPKWLFSKKLNRENFLFPRIKNSVKIGKSHKKFNTTYHHSIALRGTS